MKIIFRLFAFCYLLILCATNVYGQVTTQDTLTRLAKIQPVINQNKVLFTAEAPQLRQIAGAPKAFYSHFWEFGDGHYSRELNPTHTYKNRGEYTTRLSATNNYDDGLPPTSRPKKVVVTDVSFSDFKDENSNLIDKYYGFRLLNNRNPSPEQEMQFVISYANVADYTTQGKLYLFFNEKKFKNDNFGLVDVRTYHGETLIEINSDLTYQQPINFEKLVLTTGIQTISNQLKKVTDTIIKHNLPATLKNAQEAYRDSRAWHFDNLQAQEKRNLFLTFKTTPEMLKDTTAVISVRSVFVPNRGSDAHQVRTKEMEIVTSHDPNNMAVYNTRVNLRLMRLKPLKYKVRFQNNGEGPARLIKLNVDVPEMLDRSTLKVIDMYPKVPICPDGQEVRYSCLDTLRIKEGLSFQFKNIYLPGSNQKGVQEKDSTKGFVKYSMRFGKKVRKKPSRSQTAIIFDKNEPIITNVATSRFTTGLSVGVRVGYNYFFNKEEIITLTKPPLSTGVLPDITQQTQASSYLIGFTLSPYKSYRWYLQAEAYLDKQNYATDYAFRYVSTGAAGHNEHVRQEFTSLTKQTNLLFVPASLRYNISSVFALGTGVQFNLRMQGNSEETTEKRYFGYNQDLPNEIGEEIKDKYSKETIDTELGWKLYDYMPYVDLTIGSSRIGPSLGVRYLYPLKKKQEILQFYAIWKF